MLKLSPNTACSSLAGQTHNSCTIDMCTKASEHVKGSESVDTITTLSSEWVESLRATNTNKLKNNLEVCTLPTVPISRKKTGILFART
jgi:hypothetical protein